MAVLEALLVAYLDSALPDLGQRIFFKRLPEQAALPALAYQLISDPAQAVLAGVTEERQARVQFSIFSQTADDVVLLAEELRDALHAWREAAEGLEIVHTMVLDGGDLPSTNDTPALHARSLDASISYRRS